MTARSFTMSIDTGGTFTDGFVSDGEHAVQVKVDTTPQDLTVGFEACIEAAAAAVGTDLTSFLAALNTIHFSSTIATNTIVEGRGARVGLIVTRGAEELIYGTAPQVAALRAFVNPDLVRGIAEEVDGSGIVVAEPAEADVEAAVRELLERGVRLLVVSFANAHLNQANELRARELIGRSYPRHYLGAVPLLIASRVSLAGDDHGRTACAVVNAYLHPNLVRSLYRAEDRTRDRGLVRPLLVVNSDGSTSRVAKTRAIDTYDSGPSAGVLGASYVARALGAAHVVTFDVGGTTSDVAYLQGAEVPTDEHTEVGAARIPHPAVTLSSFGIGGGSIISVDPEGQIRVGPESAGASPGPVCFGLGGRALTPTDVWLLLGYLTPGEFLGGRRRLDVAPVETAVVELAQQLGTTTDDAVLRAKDAIRAALSGHLRRWAERHPALMASPPEDRWLFSYGGGGGLLCADAADILQIPRVVVFPNSSVFSAFGAGLLPIAHTYETVVPAGEGNGAVAAAAARLADNARRDLRAEGVRDLGFVRAAVRVGAREVSDLGLASLLEQPHGVAGLSDEDGAAVRCRLRVSVPRDADVQMLVAPGSEGARGEREIATAGGTQRVAVVGGLGDPSAAPVTGPAFLDAPDTTIFVPGGWSVTFTEHGYGILNKEPAS
jgi:N-methylhydantoinase A/acetophenone carboxylase